MNRFILVFLICFFIFCAWLHYEQRKRQKLQKKASDEFWAREEEANRTRNKDISHLKKLQISPEEIPQIETSDADIRYYIEQILQIIKEPMMDLSEFSNTDLKLAYGVGNFKELSEYEEKYNNFLILLSGLARCYESSGHPAEAIATYELALSYGSQKKKDYECLAQLYLAMDQPEKIMQLTAKLQESGHPHRESIIQSLKKILSTYQ